MADRPAALEATAAPRFALVDLVGLGFAPPALLALGFAPPALLALGFALVPLLADGLARDAFAPRGLALVGLVALPARPFLAVVASPASSAGFRAAALPFVVFPFAERLLEREVVLLDVFLRGLLVVANAFRLQGGSQMVYPFLCDR